MSATVTYLLTVLLPHTVLRRGAQQIARPKTVRRKAARRTTIAPSAIGPVIRKLLTSITTTNGSATIQVAVMLTITLTVPGSTAALPAGLAAVMFTIWAAEIASASGSAASSSMSPRTTTATLAIGIGTRIPLSFTKIPTTTAGTWPITPGSARTSTSSISVRDKQTLDEPSLPGPSSIQLRASRSTGYGCPKELRQTSRFGGAEFSLRPFDPFWRAIAAAGPHQQDCRPRHSFPASVWCLSRRLSLHRTPSPTGTRRFDFTQGILRRSGPWRHFVLRSDCRSLASSRVSPASNRNNCRPRRECAERFARRHGRRNTDPRLPFPYRADAGWHLDRHPHLLRVLRSQSRLQSGRHYYKLHSHCSRSRSAPRRRLCAYRSFVVSHGPACRLEFFGGLCIRTLGLRFHRKKRAHSWNPARSANSHRRLVRPGGLHNRGHFMLRHCGSSAVARR